MQVEDYMNETPLRLLEMLTQTREDLWRAAQALTERGVTRIILTGSGTSYHGALTARTFMQRWCALPVDVCWPFMLDDETLARSGKALVVGISQGGGSLSTLAAMERARNVGHITASMAGVAPATIDRAADYILTVPCGEETAGAKTKGYHCTVLNLMLLALAVAGSNSGWTANSAGHCCCGWKRPLTTCPRWLPPRRRGRKPMRWRCAIAQIFV